MKLINLNAISLSTGKELLSIPLDYVEDDLETEHKVKSLSDTANLTIECGTVNNNVLSKLIGGKCQMNMTLIILFMFRRENIKRKE